MGVTEQVGTEITQISKTQVKIRSRLRTIERKVRNMLDNITAANRELIDTRVGELSLERERLERKLESLAHLVLSQEEGEELRAEVIRFVAALERSLTEGPLDRRQAAIRRCVDQIVIDRDSRAVRISLRRLPIAPGGSSAAATEEITVELPRACSGTRSATLRAAAGS